MNRRTLGHGLAALLTTHAARRASAQEPEILDVRKIWDAAPHNAFTDLIRHRDRWWCVFREGDAHVSPNGALRVLSSTDGKTWESTARVTSRTADLRDAKISVTPSGELMLSGAGALNPPTTIRHQSYAWFSKDGTTWSDPTPAGDPDLWLWRITWNRGIGYGFAYNTNPDRPKRFLKFYSTRDGRRYDTVIERLTPDLSPGEHALSFQPDGSVVCLLRRDVEGAGALIGTAKPPYTDWAWKNTGTKIGGPALLRLPDGSILGAVRLLMPRIKTSLVWVDPVAGTLTPFLDLPSGGDTSYAGLVWHENQLCMSYYSTHEGKTSIYFARVRIPLKT